MRVVTCARLGQGFDDSGITTGDWGADIYVGMMERLKATPTTPAILKKRHAASSFKVCPLCGGLNIRENDECYICRWSGEFDQGPAMVGARLQEMFDRCPELKLVVRVEEATPWEKFRHRVTVFFGRFRRRIDFRA